MIRVAAVGDVHFAEDTRGTLRPHWRALRECADVLLLSGDLTNLGDVAQARKLCRLVCGGASGPAQQDPLPRQRNGSVTR